VVYGTQTARDDGRHSVCFGVGIHFYSQVIVYLIPLNTALEPLRYTASRAGRRLRLPPSLRSYGGTSEFMDDLGYTTVIEPAEPLTRLSHRSRAKTDRRGSALER